MIKSCLAFSLSLLCISSMHISPEYLRIANKVTAKAARRIEFVQNLSLIGEGGGMMHQVNNLSLFFHCKHRLAVDDARKILLYCVDELAAELNSNQKLRPNLIKFPFPVKNIEIWVFIKNPDGSELPAGEFSYMYAADGVLKYFASDAHSDRSKLLIKETYEEALQKMNEQKVSLQQLNNG